MTSKTTKIQIALFITVLVVITGIWAFNGYEDTWFYATVVIIAIPVSWFSFGRKGADR